MGNVTGDTGDTPGAWELWLETAARLCQVLVQNVALDVLKTKLKTPIFSNVKQENWIN